MMRFFRRLAHNLRERLRQGPSTPYTEVSEELHLERELKRGMRGD